MKLVGKPLKIEYIEAKTYITKYFNQQNTPAYMARSISKRIFTRLFNLDYFNNDDGPTNEDIIHTLLEGSS